MTVFLHALWRATKKLIRNVGDDELLIHAAALAFYSVLSMAPILVLLLWALSSLRPEWQNQLIDTLTHLVGSKASGGIEVVIENAKSKPHLGNLAGLIGLGITLVGASMVFAQLQRAINRIWGVRPKPGLAWITWLRARMNALALLCVLAALLMISFAGSAAIALFVSTHTQLWHNLEVVTTLILFTFIFAAIFKVLPDAIITWKDALSGAAITSILFALGKLGIGWYLNNSHIGGAYGPAGSIVLLLVWIYYSSLIVLLGAELTQAWANSHGTPIRPRAYAMRHVDYVLSSVQGNHQPNPGQ